ncbi:MAG: Phytochrome-like protein cph2 [Firmicutes bacterium ADurb.Bin193]|nr:MAG: Phytochrome-like protein cph2 [Firmicutes bacterium ADurb.Bin193]
MKNRLFNSLNLAESVSDKFRIKRLISNVYRMRLLTCLFIFYGVWVGVVNRFSRLFSPLPSFKRGWYLWAYFLLIIINLVFLMAFRRDVSYYTKNMKRVFTYENIILLYSCMSMSWGSVVSVADGGNYSFFMPFMISMLSCGVMCLIGRANRHVPFIFSSSVLFFILPFFSVSGENPKDHLFYLLVFIPIAYVASTMVYKSFCSNYEANELLEKSKEMLEHETVRNREINKQLLDANLMLKKLLSIDELTGISNRRGLQNFIDISLEKAEEESVWLSVIMMDVDFFKSFNDGYGHTAGDETLRTIAREISSLATGEAELVARYGGEEFIYVSFGTGIKDIFAIARTIMDRVSSLEIPHEFSKICRFITISLGGYSREVSCKDDVEHCIEKADKALYNAKENGRNRFCYYTG